MALGTVVNCATPPTRHRAGGALPTKYWCTSPGFLSWQRLQPARPERHPCQRPAACAPVGANQMRPLRRGKAARQGSSRQGTHLDQPVWDADHEPRVDLFDAHIHQSHTLSFGHVRLPVCSQQRVGKHAAVSMRSLIDLLHRREVVDKVAAQTGACGRKVLIQTSRTSPSSAPAE